MVFIQGGTFQMGSNDGESDEKPVHSVTVGDFYIGKYEVTQGQWRGVMGIDPPYLHNKGCDQCPVDRVSWDDVQEFIKKLNQQTGLKYRLPTEAEWEYAARGGNQNSNYQYAGSNSIDAVAWYSSNYKTTNAFGDQKTTSPVGSKLPNDLGLHDMSGNVNEWCSDWYGSDYYKNSPSSNPTGPTSGSKRVQRGGAWNVSPRQCRVANRDYYTPNNRDLYLGFRLAR
ncbi:MAG: formylglycine-generating enzyme family protein [Lewinellaceae bacterium]|nr:formylglycine-generating enzyme family protein [Lewinellaceae bacterium]